MSDYLITGKEAMDLHPGFQLIGRDKELSKLCSILVRKFSNSILLVGPSGVGASALCLGLQSLKDKEDAPFDIVSKSIFWLNVDDMFSSGDPSEIDSAFRRALNRMCQSVEPILIIEDAGDFIEACRGHGASHFINSLNGLVSSGKLQVILETNDRDASKVLSWHSDIRESYTILDITEPTGNDLMSIVNASARKLTEYHGVAISQDAISMAVDLTQKYRQSGSAAAQPKRSIELLDQALSSFRLSAHSEPPKATVIRLRIENGQSITGDEENLSAIMEEHALRQSKLLSYHASQRNAEKEILKIEEEIESEKSKRSTEDEPVKNTGPMSFASLTARNAMGSPRQQEMTEKLLKFRDALKEHKKNYSKITEEMNAELILDKETVVSEFAKISGIPAAKLGEDEKVILRTLETNLKESVFGQNPAVEKIANAIKVSKVGRRNKEKPLASYLLAGPSGVGKTEIAKQIAKQLLGNSKALTRFDMSEYMERHAVSKLIGAPPGYEGFEAGGILTNAMRIDRNRILLFDEIEKAHPDVFNLFLQILDDGRLTDNIGRVAEFSDAIIIMTTNIGQPHFLDKNIDHVQAMEGCMIDLDDAYRPEFLNRFNGRQNIIGFQRLELPSIERIIRREVDDLTSSYEDHGVTIIFTDAEIKTFCEDRYDPKIGARGLPGAINSELEPRIVNALLDNTIENDVTFTVKYDTQSHVFDVEMMPTT
jgi:ATP-dependent Clp protease ATP-binding subunit ClpB